jgi:hypothetical protein
LYLIGYYIPGFSALTVGWLVLLAGLIYAGEWLIDRLAGTHSSRLGRALVDFCVAFVVVFSVTFAIEGGHVPLLGALLAAALISLGTVFLLPPARSGYRQRFGKEGLS